MRRAAGIKAASYASDAAEPARAVFCNQAKGYSVTKMMIGMGQIGGYEGEFAILSIVPTSTNQNDQVEYMKQRRDCSSADRTPSHRA